MTPDEFWLHATRDAYRPLNAIEQAALLPLAVEWAHRGQRDRFWSLVPVLRDDGAAQLEVLSIERVEAYARLYASVGAIEASTEPKE